MLEIKNMSKSFKNNKVIDDLSYRFDSGVYGLLAPNGTGKTTLLRCITQIYPQGKNTVFYDDMLISRNRSLLNNIGYLPQQFGLFKDLKVKEALSLIANFKELEPKTIKGAVESCAQTVNLSDALDKKVGALSGGMLRRLGIAAALINNPKVLLLDEPTAGLDPEERLRFKNIISDIKNDKTIIISTHIVEDVEAICDKIIVMKDGKFVADGSCEDIRKYANNKVYCIAESEADTIDGEYFICRRYSQDDKSFLRIVAKNQQKIEATAPNIEDGYICIVKEM